MNVSESENLSFTLMTAVCLVVEKRKKGVRNYVLLFVQGHVNIQYAWGTIHI